VSDADLVTPAARRPNEGRPPGETANAMDTREPVLESGKPLVAAQSADPVGDRQVTWK
jgi:hypothetical protein